MQGPQAAAHRGQGLHRRPEAIDARFAHLIQLGPTTGELGRRPIGDRTLAERLAQRPDRSGPPGRRADDQRSAFLPPSTGSPRRTTARVREPAASNRAGVTGRGQPSVPSKVAGAGPPSSPRNP